MLNGAQFNSIWWQYLGNFQWNAIANSFENVIKQLLKYELPHDKPSKVACALSEDSDPPSLIRVFAVPMKKAWVTSYPLSAQRRLGGCSGWSESSLGARAISLVLSWGGSDVYFDEIKCLNYCSSFQENKLARQYLHNHILIWVYTVCSDLSVRKLWSITVVRILVCKTYMLDKHIRNKQTHTFSVFLRSGNFQYFFLK